MTISYIKKWINNKCYLEHRLIMEKYIGRKINDNEQVHHIDGNPKNNNINNLQLLTQKEHMQLHNKLKTKYININCGYCNKQITIRKKYYDWKIKNGQKKFYCSRQCIGYSRKFNQNIFSYEDIIKNEFNKGKTGYQISKDTGINKTTVYKYIKKIKTNI